MEQLPLISVIVPVYRVEQYLDKCVSSILSQTYDNLELILVDDGSPDRSGEICDRWAEADSRVRVIHQKNAGGGAARNAGLDAAGGEFISMIDSDDYIHPNMYRHLYDLMRDGVDIAECVIAQTEDDSLQMDDGSEAKITVFSCEEAMALHIRDELFCQTPPNKLYRRSAIGDVRFFVGTMIDDEFFTYRVIGNAQKLAHSTARMYAYRQQPGSVMHRKNPLKKLEGLRAKKRRLSYLRERLPKLVDPAKVELMLACIYGMQTILRDLEGDAREEAAQEIRDLIRDLQPINLDCADSAKQKLLIRAAVRCPEAVAKLLNFLIDIHILT